MVGEDAYDYATLIAPTKPDAYFVDEGRAQLIAPHENYENTDYLVTL
jgi:hypothetical protein